MVGRSSVSSLLLVMAALIMASPAAAEPASLLAPHPPTQPASLAAVAASASSASSGGSAIEIMAPAGLEPDVSTSAVVAAVASSGGAAATDDPGILDPTEAITAPAIATAPGPRPPVPAERRDERGQEPDSGEIGVEYQLSVRDAASFLDRVTARFKRLVEQAMTYLGTPYRLGGTTRRGLDCSGLVGAVYGEQGLDLPRTAAQQFAEGVAVAGDLRPGDLVFFRDTYKRGISHVGIYIGEGRFLHAAGHRHGVILSELSRPYYRLRYAGARRPASELATGDLQARQAVQSTPSASDRAIASTVPTILAAAPR